MFGSGFLMDVDGCKVLAVGASVAVGWRACWRSLSTTAFQDPNILKYSTCAKKTVTGKPYQAL